MLHLNVDVAHEVTVVTTEGPFTLADWNAAVTALATHPYPLATQRVILDRRTDWTVDSADFARTMAALAGDDRAAVERRWVVLVNDDPAAASAAQLFAATLGEAGFEAAQFQDPATALDWLFDGDGEEPIPAPSVSPVGITTWSSAPFAQGAQIGRLWTAMPRMLIDEQFTRV